MTQEELLKKIAAEKSLFLIAGPCVVEGEELCMNIAGYLSELCDKYGIPYIFKASYRKANRTSNNSFQGIGDDIAIDILKKVRSSLNVPVLTDVHETGEVEMAAEVADILQIPAFLARQTDLLKAAGKTGKWVNIKKGQFMSPDSIGFAMDKVKNTGNSKIMVTERGTFFGYQDLVVDFRSLIHMQSFDCPVIFDATHSLQKPNQTRGVTGGNPEYIIPMARAALSTGINGIFIETHPNPSLAMSDGENMLPISLMESLIQQLIKIKKAISD
jgi:2-dehydro-3-deoxyphosphooctonate aldolase (KDO 8-P synthase)